MQSIIAMIVFFFIILAVIITCIRQRFDSPVSLAVSDSLRVQRAFPHNGPGSLVQLSLWHVSLQLRECPRKPRKEPKREKNNPLLCVLLFCADLQHSLRSPLFCVKTKMFFVFFRHKSTQNTNKSNKAYRGFSLYDFIIVIGQGFIILIKRSLQLLSITGLF